MIRTRKIGLAIVLSLLVTVSIGNSARALETVDVGLARDPQLFITGYQRDETGSRLQFIQLYNNYDIPINLQEWGLYVDNVTDTQKIHFESDAPNGYVQPKGHVVITIDVQIDTVSSSYVKGASYFNMTAPAFTNNQNAALIVHPPSVAERDAVYTLKSSSLTVKNPGTGKNETHYIFDEVWLRSQSTSAGYTTSFTATVPNNLIDNHLYYIPPIPAVYIAEVYAYSSDCAPTDPSVLCGDYIKLRVEDLSQDISRYVLRTSNNSTSRTTTNTFYLEDYTVQDGFLTVATTENGDRINLTNSGGYIWLEDLYGLQQYNETMTQYESFGSAKQGYSQMFVAGGVGQWSTTPSPFTANTIIPPVVAVAVCPEGKYLNPDTNRCRTIEEAVNALATCPEGQYRNPTTNRCRQVASTTSSLVPCGEGQERNPATNRCRSTASAVTELIPCNEGYERNPATNRCRKVSEALSVSSNGVSSSNEGADTQSPLAAWGWALAGVAAAGAIGYGVYEWRHEIIHGWKLLVTRLGKK